MLFNGRRNRVFYFVWFLFIIVIGFLTRVFDELLPSFLGQYLPDTLWGLMVFFGIAMLFENMRTRRVAVYALVFAYGIECSQLLTHPTLMDIRQTTFGGLLLGRGFLWSDMICYTVGILVGVLVELYAQKRP